MAFAMPENINELTVEQLQDAIEDALVNYKGLDLSEESTDEEIARAEDLAASVKALRGEIVAREQAAAAKKERLNALDEEMAELDPKKKKVEVEEEVDVIVDEIIEDEVPVEDEVPIEDEVPVEDVSDEEVEEELPKKKVAASVDVEPEPVVEEEVPLAASVGSSTSPTQRAAANAPSINLPKEAPMVALTAAADVPGFATGAKLETFADVGEAVIARMRSFPTGSMGQPVFNRYGAAHIRKEFAAELSQDNYRDDEALLNAAADQSRLSGGSLVAAGGWCAPSEVLYDLCGGEAADGILSIPEVQVTRGGIRFARDDDWSEIFASGFDLTEAQVMALDGTPGKSKPCYEVDCPTPEEVRLNAIGLCIKAGILTNAAYPERVANTIRKSLVAHELRMNAGVIAKIKAAAGAALTPVNQESTVSNLESLVWVAISLRTKYGLPESYTVEVVLPQWAKQSIREDLARRNGQITASVSNQQINAWFADRDLAVQFVRGLDDLNVSSALQVKPPTTATALLYPAGAFVKGTASVITLDAVYDSTNLASNTYTALFSEEGYLVANRCYGGAAVTIPVCDSGRSGAADLVACFGTAETAAP